MTSLAVRAVLDETACNYDEDAQSTMVLVNTQRNTTTVMATV